MIGWLGAIAVLSNVLAGVLGHAPARAAGVVDDLFRPQLLCTSDGSETVPHRGGGPDSPGDGKAHCSMACALLGGFAPAIAVALSFAVVLFPIRIFPRLTSGARTLADHLSLGGIRSRAPPLPV